jgi:repressor LexA
MLKDILKRLRKENGLTQSQLANRLGVSQQAVAKWEAGLSAPEPHLLLPVAGIFHVSADYLLGREGGFFGNLLPCGVFSPVPVAGTVRAGYGRDAFEDIQGTHPADVRDPKNYFYLTVQGDSMEPYIRDGDLALVRRQNTLLNGELGVIVLRGGEGTLKRFFSEDGKVLLKSFNPSTPPVELSGADLDGLFIAGKVVETKTRW